MILIITGIHLSHPNIMGAPTASGMLMYSMRLSTVINTIIIIIIMVTHINTITTVNMHTTTLSNTNNTCINNSLVRRSCQLVHQGPRQVWHQLRLALSLKELMLVTMVNNSID
jgi:hypothetical protein